MIPIKEIINAVVQLDVGEKLVVKCTNVKEANSIRTAVYRESAKIHRLFSSETIQVERIKVVGGYNVLVSKTQEPTVLIMRKDGTVEELGNGINKGENPSLEDLREVEHKLGNVEFPFAEREGVDRGNGIDRNQRSLENPIGSQGKSELCLDFQLGMQDLRSEMARDILNGDRTYKQSIPPTREED